MVGRGMRNIKDTICGTVVVCWFFGRASFSKVIEGSSNVLLFAFNRFLGGHLSANYKKNMAYTRAGAV